MGAAQQILAGLAAASGGGGGGDPGTTEYVTGQTLGTLHNDFDGSVGMRFTVGASPVVVKSLGIWVVAGNTQSVTVQVGSSSDGGTTFVSLGSVTIPTSGAPAAAYKYVELASHVTLSASTDYWIIRSVVDGGDQWYNASDTLITTTAVAELYGAYYFDGALHLSATDKSYGPVSFKY